jgi:NitT/TauT family transport system permease protein
MSRINWPGASFLVGLAILWEITGQLSPSPNLPAFSTVVVTLVTNFDTIAMETLQTLKRAALGFLIALATMLPLGVFLGRVKAAGELVEPIIEFIRPLPPIAMIPVAMIFLGIGDPARVAVVAYGCAFPILINAMEAVRGAHPMLGNVARSLRLTRGEQMRLIDLPAAMPQIMAGIRISLATALLLSVVAEMLLAANGLGTYIVRAQERFQIAHNLAALLTIVILALIINALLERADRKLLAWHHARHAAHHD